MSAVVKQEQTIRTVSKGRPQGQSKAAAIVNMALASDATNTEIAAAVDTCKSNVTHTLKRYGIERNVLDSYKKNRIEVLQGIQVKLLSQINEDKLKKASVNNIAYAFQQFHTAERLESGQSTSNTLSVTLSGPLTDAVQRITTRQSQPDNPCQTTTNSQSTNTINKIDKS